MPDWSPVRRFGGYGAWADGAPMQAALRSRAAACGCSQGCGVHGHAHTRAASVNIPAADLKGFLGCAGLRLLGELDHATHACRLDRRLALLALCAAYLQGGFNKAIDFDGAIGRDAALRPRARRPAGARYHRRRDRCFAARGVRGLALVRGAHLAGFTLFATLVANRFWEMVQPERFMAANSFFEHIGLNRRLRPRGLARPAARDGARQ